MLSVPYTALTPILLMILFTLSRPVAADLSRILGTGLIIWGITSLNQHAHFMDQRISSIANTARRSRFLQRIIPLDKGSQSAALAAVLWAITDLIDKNTSDNIDASHLLFLENTVLVTVYSSLMLALIPKLSRKTFHWQSLLGDEFPEERQMKRTAVLLIVYSFFHFEAYHGYTMYLDTLTASHAVSSQLGWAIFVRRASVILAAVAFDLIQYRWFQPPLNRRSSDDFDPDRKLTPMLHRETIRLVFYCLYVVAGLGFLLVP